MPGVVEKCIENDFHYKNALEIFLLLKCKRNDFYYRNASNDFYNKNSLVMLFTIKMHY